MYVAEVGRVLKLTDMNGDGVYETRSVLIDGLPTGGNHTTRTIVIDSAHQKIYISVGSSCNVCREDNRAVIMQYNIDGTGGRIYASGARNAVGMTLHPRTGMLWADNNGTDDLGDNVPPEWIDMVRENGFYGWPLAHSYQVYNDFSKTPEYQALLPVTAADSARVATMVRPGALIQAHSAPMAIEFPNSSAFPEQYGRGAFVVLRGSWNRTVPTGYKVIYLDFDNDQDTIANTASDFLTGFLTDSTGGSWARPVGLESDMGGNLYLTSNDQTQFVMMISRAQSSGVGPETGASTTAPRLEPVLPNPVTSAATVRFSLPASGPVSLRVFDVLGREVRAVISDQIVAAGEREVTVDMSDLAAGAYFYRLDAAGTTLVERVQLVR
jgi:glucose/arabinose dehydrogenase